MEAIEAPMSWFAVGQLVSLVALAWLGHVSFGMPVWQSVIAVALSFLLALVACRVTGETDTTPVGAMGKVTQLTFGALSPGNVNVNLMSANITAGAATSAADLLTDLKSGYLLGAQPATAVPRPVRRHLRRHARNGAHLCCPGAQRPGARHGPVPGARRPDLVSRRHRARPRACPRSNPSSCG